MLVDGQERERRHHGTILRGRDGVVESGRRPGADERVVEPARPVLYDTRARAVCSVAHKEDKSRKDLHKDSGFGSQGFLTVDHLKV